MATKDTYINNRNVLFITTKNLDYIRIVQELKMLEEDAAYYQVIGSYSQHYPVRLMSVYLKLLVTSVKRYDTVFLGFAPQLILPFWKWKFRKTRLVIDFFISFYDTLCNDRKKIKPDSILGRYLHRLDEMVLNKAEFVFCDALAHGKYFEKEFQVPSQKIFTMYLEADASIYHPLNLPRPKNLMDKYVVLYFGSGLPLHGIDIVLKAMTLLRECDKLHFLFFGPIKDKKLIRMKPVADNIEYIEWVSQDKLAEYIDMADLCLAGHFNASIQKASRVIPGKAYIYQAMDKYMILGDNEANHERFDNCKKAVFVEMGNEKALADAILHYAKRN